MPSAFVASHRHRRARALVLALLLGGLALGTAGAQEGPAPNPSFTSLLRWRELGPANMGGRITSLAVNPQRPAQWWVGTAGGGLLHSQDGGESFAFSNSESRTSSVGDVAVCAGSPHIVYVGMGEANPRNSVSWGDGVYRSEDGGRTFQSAGLKDAFQIGAVVVHPEDPQRVFVGVLGRLWGPSTTGGVYRTADGGRSWQRVLHVDERTGVVDVALDPHDPRIVWAASWERERDATDNNDPIKRWGPGSGLWKSIDGGDTWRRIVSGLPTCAIGRMGMALSPSKPGRMYLVVESERIGQEPPDAPFMGLRGQDVDDHVQLAQVSKDGPAAKAGLVVGDRVLRVDDIEIKSTREMVAKVREHRAGETVGLQIGRGEQTISIELKLGSRPANQRGQSPFAAFLGGQRENLQAQQGSQGAECGGIYRSDDAGETWRRVNSLNPRPMYFSEIRVDPADGDHVYVLGIQLYRSRDGGETFASDVAPAEVHVDHHALWIDPTDSDHLRMGTDGGIYTSRDGGKRWSHLNHVAIGQYYDVALSARADYHTYGGLQDNGTWGGPHRVRHGPGPSNHDYYRVGGGDGFRCQVDPSDPEQIYFEMQRGGLGRLHLGSGERARLVPAPVEGQRWRFNWNTPFLLSYHNSGLYYAAGNVVFRSLDRGRTLRVTSPQLARTADGTATALAESPLDADLLFVGTDDGALWRTIDGGHVWTELRELPARPVPEAVEPAETTERAEPSPVPAETETAPESEEETHPPKAPAQATTGENPAPAPLPGERLVDLVPDPRHVAWIEPSRFVRERVYVVLDAHRSNEERPWVLCSEDAGRTWRALHGSLEVAAGTTRVLREDLENPDLLYLGTEFGAYVSLDRGEQWTALGEGLSPVAIHALAQHPTVPEIVVATHGRSLWALDVCALRQLVPAVREAPVHLLRPRLATQWRSLPARGTSRAHVASNPPGGAEFIYRLAEAASQVSLEVTTLDDRPVARLEAPTSAGWHSVRWNLRSDPPARARSRRGPLVEAGAYLVTLTVGGQTFVQPLQVELDPEHAGGAWLSHQEQAQAQEREERAAKAARHLPASEGRVE